MHIWVDLVNSPQVLVLAPVIAELQRRGHHVVITSRDFAQTVALADRMGLVHTPLGRHAGAGGGRLAPLRVNLQRVLLLLRWLRGRRIDLALSHNSYSQGLAARLRGIPFVTMMDYEHHRANHLAFRLARRVLVPAPFPEAALRRFGAARKAVRYPGLKEELYLGGFVPSPGFLREHGIPEDRILVVMRPPGTWAGYYHGEGALFRAALARVLETAGTFTVFLPRLPEQAATVRDIPPDRLLVPAQALDGPNLLAHAGLVISAGGTMNREAAALGVPAFTAFEGRPGAVDRELVARGRLRLLTSAADVAAMPIVRRAGPLAPPAAGGTLVTFVTDAILAAIQPEAAATRGTAGWPC